MSSPKFPDASPPTPKDSDETDREAAANSARRTATLARDATHVNDLFRGSTSDLTIVDSLDTYILSDTSAPTTPTKAPKTNNTKQEVGENSTLPRQSERDLAQDARGRKRQRVESPPSAAGNRNCERASIAHRDTSAEASMQYATLPNGMRVDMRHLEQLLAGRVSTPMDGENREEIDPMDIVPIEATPAHTPRLRARPIQEGTYTPEGTTITIVHGAPLLPSGAATCGDPRQLLASRAHGSGRLASNDESAVDQGGWMGRRPEYSPEDPYLELRPMADVAGGAQRQHAGPAWAASRTVTMNVGVGDRAATNTYLVPQERATEGSTGRTLEQAGMAATMRATMQENPGTALGQIGDANHRPRTLDLRLAHRARANLLPPTYSPRTLSPKPATGQQTADAKRTNTGGAPQEVRKSDAVRALPPLTATTTAEQRVNELNENGALKVVAKPTGGFPDREPLSPDDVVRHIYGVNSQSAGLEDAKEILTATIATIGGRGGVDTLVPALWRDPTHATEVPTVWFVYGLFPDLKRVLAEYGTWSTSRISFFVRDEITPVPRYLITLGGFLRDDTTLPETIKDILRDPILFEPLVSALDDGVTENARVEQLAHEYIEKMEVRVRRRGTGQLLGQGGIVAILYAAKEMKHLMTPQTWEEYSKVLAKTGFAIEGNGEGRAREKERCRGCHAGDHADLACRYPRVYGWLGILPKVQDAREHSGASSTREPPLPRNEMAGTQGVGRRRAFTPTPTVATRGPPFSLGRGVARGAAPRGTFRGGPPPRARGRGQGTTMTIRRGSYNPAHNYAGPQTHQSQFIGNSMQHTSDSETYEMASNYDRYYDTSTRFEETHGHGEYE
ncbi:hypothetical protein GY45DRAFT_1367520 [Cubamyces sp. BRFM 1775]|nr:hypothetical protein GY45DRAFT_1367520 [Cubamyces sp. BRFM 1775]